MIGCTLLFKRGTKAQLDSAAASSLLNIGEPYFITDTGQIAVGASTSTYKLFYADPYVHTPAEGGLGANFSGTPNGTVPLFNASWGQFRPSYPFLVENAEGKSTTTTLIKHEDEWAGIGTHAFTMTSHMNPNLSTIGFVHANGISFKLDNEGAINFDGSYFNAPYTEMSVSSLEATTDVVANQLFIGTLERLGAPSGLSFSSNQNNWNPSLTNRRWLTANVTGAYTITGMAAGNAGERRLFTNSGTGSLTIAHQSTSSTTNNRFMCPGNTNFTLRANGSVEMIYDGSQARWRIIAP